MFYQIRQAFLTLKEKFQNFYFPYQLKRITQFKKACGIRISQMHMSISMEAT
jgi:hypothetical protein